jgi:histidine triad (HIT) family protein
MESVFTKIINGSIHSNIIYEDDKTFVFLDMSPVQDGHCLVIPKLEVDHFDDLPDEYITALFLVTKKIAKALKKTFNCKRVSMMVSGFDVLHCHIHLVPTNFANELFTKSINSSNLNEIQTSIINNL